MRPLPPQPCRHLWTAGAAAASRKGKSSSSKGDDAATWITIERGLLDPSFLLNYRGKCAARRVQLYNCHDCPSLMAIGLKTSHPSSLHPTRFIMRPSGNLYLRTLRVIVVVVVFSNFYSPNAIIAFQRYHSAIIYPAIKVAGHAIPQCHSTLVYTL